MTIDRQAFRNAMSELGAAVNVITSDGRAGRYGMTASAVCSITDDPPTLAVCVNRASQSNVVFKENGVLCVNTLNAEQEDISAVFAGATKCAAEARFETGSWTRQLTGAPVLDDAVVSFDCVITDSVEKGTHTVFFAEVVKTRYASKDCGGLIYFRRGYHHVGADELEALAA
ncbi:flavin reductase [Cupriavidus consociatus]|uniref:flavin reductase n=1 Tax=Cupriavidus consociatus TaxID=2821357 RepID=UPI001AE6CD75|nr:MULTISPECIES: flavin reductase [unclassified Cupriavidus]MBP0625403.1 flavin reductase [Cupriavidus sp. LEh25]MDK2662145.1 flavin reductase [Cupriavidus sp. LEh21]